MNGIYVHIPFCLKKCAYCDFVSYASSFDLKDEYINSVICEMKKYKGEKADTIYIGGGTPTTLPRSLLCKLIFALRDNFVINENAEITVECNPKTADLEYFKALKDAGVNRLSIGVQSLCNNELAFLGRIHTANDALSCIENAKAAGLSNFNVDIMFGLGCQTKESVLSTLKNLISLSPSHFSCYSLIVEENTPFGKLQAAGNLSLMHEDAERELYHEIIAVLKAAGYAHYEISNFAKDGFYSKHNIKYWRRMPYIGLGAAAHSFYENKRFSNPCGIKEYINSVKNNLPIEKESVSFDDEISEFIFLGLRMTEGISKKEFRRCFGKDINELFSSEITELKKLNLMAETNDRLRLTLSGIDVSNEVFIKFLR